MASHHIWRKSPHISLSCFAAFLPVDHFHWEKGRKKFLGIFFYFRLKFWKVLTKPQLSIKEFLQNESVKKKNVQLPFTWRILSSVDLDRFEVSNLQEDFWKKKILDGSPAKSTQLSNPQGATKFPTVFLDVITVIHQCSESVLDSSRFEDFYRISSVVYWSTGQVDLFINII